MKNWKNMTNLVTFGIALTALMPRQGFAQDTSTYSFSGPCSSQGSWTNAALAHTQTVKNMIIKLKDNPACNALKARIEGGMSGIEQNLQEIDQAYENSGGKARSLSQLPQEINALRAFAREHSPFRSNAIDLLMGKAITQSAMSSQKADYYDGPSKQQTSSSLGAIAHRAHRATTSGLNLFNSTMSAIQEAEADCLDNTNGLGVISGMVKILSSFASSGNDSMGSQLAMAVQNLGQYLSREKKYIEALRKLNDREFISSMSCLIEITSDGYCSALDAQYMFQEIINNQTVKLETYINKRTGKEEKKVVGMNENFIKKLEKGPLAGYYVLTRMVPIITDWMQKIQYGITPQLPSEATFQIGISTNVYEHHNTLKRIEGNFNFQRGLLISDLKEFKAKQTYVLEMLNDAANQMIPQGFGRNANSENFFAKVSTPNEIFFRLLGIPTPEAVLGSGPEAIQFTNNPDGWLQAKYRNLPLFNDPDKLSEIIYENMQILFKESTDIAIAYYNKYFIVDKIQVINDSLLGLDSNVRDALVHLDLYLKNLELRIKNDSHDPTIIASIIDTRLRISRVLAKYRELRNFSISLLKQNNENSKTGSFDEVEFDTQLKRIGYALLQHVYNEFQVLTARTGFLSKRMAGFVFQDYTLSLRKRDEFNQYFNEFMLATGYNSLHSMMNISQSEFTKIKADLDQAMNIYKKNIDALEGVVQQGFVRNIFDLKLMADGKELTEYQRLQASLATAERMGRIQIPGEDSNAVQRAFRGTITQIWLDLTSKDMELLGAPNHVEKLVIPIKSLGNWLLGERGKIVVSPVSEFDTAENEMAKLCTQALAFPNLRPYWELCHKAVLPSPLMHQNTTDPELKKIIEEYLSVNVEKKAWEHLEAEGSRNDRQSLARNYQARICALRDYHRRNEVARMTSAMRDDGDTYENEFLKPVTVEDQAPQKEIWE